MSCAVLKKETYTQILNSLNDWYAIKLPNRNLCGETLQHAINLAYSGEAARDRHYFEIDRTVRHVKNPVGTIERVSVAVVIHDP